MPARERNTASTAATPSPSRVVIEAVEPEIDGGRFPVKRTPGELVEVTADIHAEGHDSLAACLLHRRSEAAAWSEARMEPLPNDRWRGSFRVQDLQTCEYTIRAWVDHFRTWRNDLGKRLAAAQDVAQELLTGADIVHAAARRATGEDQASLRAFAALLGSDGAPAADRIAAALDEERARLVDRHPDLDGAVTYERVLRVAVDPPLARFSAWYEMFPRSASPEPGRHGTFRDCEARLDDIAAMGFDVLYLPPIHPIGRTCRKGKNNTEGAAPDDVGSPWAIGGPEGGHDAVHPALGTMDDFRRLVSAAREKGIEVALDLALQCSPDHPWVAEHPEWFRRRHDGSIRYAENPPKKYQDIYPIDFDTPDRDALWRAIQGVVRHWIAQGIRVFRVDNPHTKPYALWEWLIGSLKRERPDLIFLSEAFTRPKVMYRLAKVGFSQSYTYFTWRNTTEELRSYFTALTGSPIREFFRPSLWPTTPDILPEYLQAGGRPAFIARAVLAATLGANWGIYGPAYELCEAEPLAPGREEYLHSEKYEIRHWDLARSDSLRPVLARLNRIRHESPALQRDAGLRFHETTNGQIIAYTKSTDDYSDVVLVVVNLDPHHRHSGFVELPLEELGIDLERSFQAHDLMSAARYLWQGGRNYVELDPQTFPAHIFKLRRHLRTERDFDYYL